MWPPDPGLAASGVAAFDKFSAPAAISEVVPIAPHEFVPGTNIDDSTQQITFPHDDLDAQTDNFGSSSKKFQKAIFYPSKQTFKIRARPNARQRRRAAQLVDVNWIRMSI